MLKVIILILAIISLNIVDVGFSIEYKYLPSGTESLGPSSGSPRGSSGGSSHDHTPYATETISANVTREILSPTREDGFFNESNETIVCLVKITSLAKGGLKNLEIWEMPETGLRILNCTYPIITSSIGKIQEYKVSDKSSFRNEDIINISSIIDKLQNNGSIIHQHVYSLLSYNTKLLISNNNSTEENLTNALVEDFNKIINNNSDSNFNVTYFRGSSFNLRANILIDGKSRDLFQGFSNQSKSFLENDDFRLFKRRLLEGAFPGGIRRINYYKEHENLYIGNNDYINICLDKIGNAVLNKKESIIFKYYLVPEKLGKTEINSIIRADDFYLEGKTIVDIIEREPKFLVTYTSPSKELTKNEWVEFEYHITYLGGDDDEKLFNVSIDPENHKSTKAPFFEVNTSNINKTILFRRGCTENFIIPVKYLEEGSHLARPLVSFNGIKEKIIEADLSVYDKKNLQDKLHYESNANIIAEELLGAQRVTTIGLFIELLILIIIEVRRKL